LPEALLSCEGLTYRYEDGTVALRGVDLKVGPGERVGVIGPNGSGKSTLLLCLAGLLTGEGIVRLKGDDVTRRTSKRQPGQVGLVFQGPDDQLFMPTVRDDLAFGPINLGLPADQVDRRVADAAAVLGLQDLLDRAPHHLSMGQKRVAAIATVLTMQPALLLMDEPSSNLDPRSRRKLIELLGGLDAALLIASHDLALVERLCERLVLLDDGTIAAEGPTSAILGDAELLERHGLAV